MSIDQRVTTVASTDVGWRRKMQVRLFALDLVAVAVALGTAVTIRFGDETDRRVSGLAELSYPQTAVLLGIAWLATIAAFGGYSLRVVAVGSAEYHGLARATWSTFGGIAIFAALFQIQFARGFLLVALPLGLFLLLVGRLAARRMLVRQRERGEWVERALVVGSPVEVRYVVDAIERASIAGYKVVAVATGGTDTEFELADGGMLPEMGLPEDAARSAVISGATAVVVAGQSSSGPTFLRDLGWALEDTDCDLVLASRMTDVAGPRIHWQPVDGLPLIAVDMPRYTGVKYLGKRAFDVIVGGLGTLALMPVMLIAALAIKLEDRGPIFYRQERVGVNGDRFRITKFRSMVPDAEAKQAELRARHDGNAILFKLRADPRVTRVGRFIRRYSIDELPQLFDVLRGDMSLVGPRPPLPTEVDSYDQHVHRRLYVKPGITGPWQVGGRSNLTWDESVRKDLYYVENWSITGDLLILVKTVRAVIRGDGAY
ncbi:sugar transferase [Calidifontibacter indicus]|uniref:sugar transferase n=1 Tax=Calidifontibacter indicus TaxID=419650 RepID=UPI003D713312